MTMLDSVKEEEVVVEFPEGSKRKRLSRTELKEVKKKGRWSAERYRRGEQSLLEIMKGEGASIERPMSRPALRVAARKRIGDTGLLDHLLKHIEGKAALGGTHRFRRWCDTAGVMQYWLEDAHLAPLPKPLFWTPPTEARALRDQVKQLSASVQSQQHQVVEMFKDVIEWKAETNQLLNLVLSSMQQVDEDEQDMYQEMKPNVEPWEEWLDLGSDTDTDTDRPHQD